MEPLGSYQRWLPPAAGLGVGAVAVVLGAGLMELSRTLAEVARGVAFFLNGLPPALAFVAGATAALAPLVVIDTLPAERGRRFPLLLALFAVASAPALLEPRSIVDSSNALARALFH